MRVLRLNPLLPLAWMAIMAVGACAQSRQDWQLGTLLSVTSASDKNSFAAPLGPGSVAIPLPRNQHAYVIAGGDKEYVIGESTPLEAHLTVNRTLYYAADGKRFVFVDNDGYEHRAEILRETSLEQAAMPRNWKSAVGGERLQLRLSSDGQSLYAEDVDPEAAGRGYRTQYEARLSAGQGQYVGQVHRTMPCGTFHAEVDLTSVGPERIEGFLMGPPSDARWNGRTCTYSKPNQVFRLVWIPE